MRHRAARGVGAFWIQRSFSLGAVLGAIVLSMAGLEQIFLIAAVATVLGTVAIALLSGPEAVTTPEE